MPIKNRKGNHIEVEHTIQISLEGTKSGMTDKSMNQGHIWILTALTACHKHSPKMIARACLANYKAEDKVFVASCHFIFYKCYQLSVYGNIKALLEIQALLQPGVLF